MIIFYTCIKNCLKVSYSLKLRQVYNIQISENLTLKTKSTFYKINEIIKY